ncbi:MAG: transposase family protein, partial [Methylococcales bacterium]|nr:transposase family protein [Methylococcales bacterium]
MNLVSHLASIPDHRRGQGMKYDLGSILLFSIMAVLSGATSYQKIERYIHNHRKRLNELCNINWKRAPAHNSIRYA